LISYSHIFGLFAAFLQAIPADRVRVRIIFE
jgi:hypothetical protein